MGAHSWRRGQSNLIGAVVLLVIVVTVSVAIVAAGSAALQSSQRSTSLESATVSMTNVDGTISSLVADPQTAQALTVDGLSGGDVSVVEEGSFRVVVTDADTGATLLDRSTTLGYVAYRNGGTTVAYQGGGVFRSDDATDGTAVVSAPNVDYGATGASPTLSIPVVAISGEASGGELSLTHAGETSLFPAGGLSNPMRSNYDVTITVESRFYEGWRRVFARQTDATITSDPTAERVSVTFHGESPESGTITDAIVSSTGAELTNLGQIDSYDSANGPYSGTFPVNTDAAVVVDDNLDITSTPEIGGDVVSEGGLVITNDATIHGDVITGQNATDDQIRTMATVEGTFSTQDDLDIRWGSEATIGEDLIVGGTLSDFDPASVGGSIHVHEDAKLHHGGNGADVAGNVTVVENLTFDGNVNLQNGPTSVAAGEDVIAKGGVHDTDVYAGDDVVIENGEIHGDVYAQDDVVIESGAEVHGDVYAGGNIGGGGVIVGGSRYENSNPPAPPMGRLRSPVDPSVTIPDAANDRIDRVANASDWDEAPGTRAGIVASAGCDSGCTLTAGRYNVSRLKIVDGESLTFDTSDGDVILYVENGVHVKGDVEVTGPNQTRIYVEDELTVEKSTAEVTTPNDNASQLWVYLNADERAEFTSGNPVFTGVVYGPGNASHDGADVHVTKQATIYGAVVGSVAEYSEDAEIHFDENLEGARSFRELDTNGKINYLHLSARQVEVES